MTTLNYLRTKSVLPLMASALYDHSMSIVSDAQINQALSRLLPDRERGDDVIDDLCIAARVALQRRVDNSRDGGIVIAALRMNGLTWKQIAVRTKIPTRTARRWSVPPDVVETDEGGAQ